MLAYEYINKIAKSGNLESAKKLVLSAQKDISVSDLDFCEILQEYQNRKNELEANA